MAKKKTAKKNAPNKLACPKCGENDPNELTVIGTANINWNITEVVAGEIHPEEGVDWNLAEFDTSSYILGCRECDETFDIPKGFKLTETWGGSEDES